MNQFRIGSIFNHLILIANRHGKHRIAKFLNQSTYNRIIGHTNTDLFPLLINLWQPSAGWKYKGERARQILFQKLKSGITDLSILADVRQVVTDNRQITFLGINTFQRTDSLHCPDIQGIAAYGVNRIGGINHQTAVTQNIYGFSHLTGIRILGIDFYEHNLYDFNSSFY